MSRKTTAALVAALGINFAMAGGAMMLANLNKPTEFDMDAAFASGPGDLTTVADVAVDPEAGDLAIPLKAAQLGGNTRVTFTCGKGTGGGTREVHEGTWDQIAGGVLYRPEEAALLAVEAKFDTRSLRTDAQGLTNTVTVKEKWFDIDNHPIATFQCDEVVAVDAATTSHTHILIGTFTLNGITKPIEIPAKLTFSGQSLVIDAAFTILRSDYDVEKREGSIAGTLGSVVSTVEDEVELTVRVNASSDPAAAIGDLATLIESQAEALAMARKDIELLQGLSARLELLEEKTDRLATSGGATRQTVNSDGLPKTFTDTSQGYDVNYAFDMVLVPGDEAAGINPLYFSRHEVTWGMFDKWMQAGDLDGQSENVVSKLRELGLRPTPLYGDPQSTVQFNAKDNPVMGVSRLTATAYCKWLTEQTGRNYRLPTMSEWQHALRLGGGVPENLDAHAWHATNSPLDDDFTRLPITSKVMGKQANSLGLHDMLGSVAEWVTDTGTERVVVGGSIFTEPDEITAEWKAVEDLEVWSEKYPNYPKSRYWYSDFYVTGIRLVCEPASVAASPPADQ